MPERLSQALLEARSAELRQEAANIFDEDQQNALLRRADIMEDAARIADLWEASPLPPRR